MFMVLISMVVIMIMSVFRVLVFDIFHTTHRTFARLITSASLAMHRADIRGRKFFCTLIDLRARCIRGILFMRVTMSSATCTRKSEDDEKGKIPECFDFHGANVRNRLMSNGSRLTNIVLSPQSVLSDCRLPAVDWRL